MTSYSVSSGRLDQAALALDTAVTTLTNNGFTIVGRTSTTATLNGSGMNSTNQPALLGATKIDLRIVNDALQIDAVLGGVDSMRRFLFRFPLLLGIGLGLLFGVGGGLMFGRQFGIGFGVPWAAGWRWIAVAMCGALLPVSPWLVLSPLIANSILNRTRRALDVLAGNARHTNRAA